MACRDSFEYLERQRRLIFKLCVLDIRGDGRSVGGAFLAIGR